MGRLRGIAALYKVESIGNFCQFERSQWMNVSGTEEEKLRNLDLDTVLSTRCQRRLYIKLSFC